jgi:hypothetical protein
MHVHPLVVAPSAEPEAAAEALVLRPESGLGAVIHAQASLVPYFVVLDAARRGAASWTPTSGDGPVLRSWVSRIASAVRQAGEACELGGLAAAAGAGDGGDFTPDPARHACAFCLEGAFVRVVGGTADVAAIGRCAVARWRSGVVEPLHTLHTIAALRSPDFVFESEAAHDIVTSVVGRDPDRLLGDLTELRVELEAGDQLLLMSPALGTRVVGRGILPQVESARTAAGLLAWLEERSSGSPYVMAALISE